MRSYSVDVVALAVGVDHKWLDNLLSHHSVPGVVGGRQGVARRIQDEGLFAIEAIRLLNSELGIPMARAVALVKDTGDSPDSDLVIRTESGVVVQLPASDLRRRLRARLDDALEAAPRIPRGRPPRVPQTRS